MGPFKFKKPRDVELSANVMKLPRRRFLRLAAGAAALPALLRIAFAIDYPMRPARLIVGFAGGGPTDVAARVVAEWLSQHSQFIVENRTGVGGNLATEAVVHSPPDGYTLLFGGPSITISMTLYKNLPFNDLGNLTPVASGLDRTATAIARRYASRFRTRGH